MKEGINEVKVLHISWVCVGHLVNRDHITALKSCVSHMIMISRLCINNVIMELGSWITHVIISLNSNVTHVIMVLTQAVDDLQLKTN